MIYGLIALILPTFSLGATEILLEPSGGRAIVVDTDVLMKRNSPIIEDPIVEEKKSSDVSEENSEDKYKVDKRAAILLDKIMYAVQKALDEDKNGKVTPGHGNIAAFTGQRQTTGLDNKVYWKCYFNAVSCF